MATLGEKQFTHALSAEYLQLDWHNPHKPIYSSDMDVWPNRVLSLAQGQSYDCPNAREVTLKAVGKTNYSNFVYYSWDVLWVWFNTSQRFHLVRSQIVNEDLNNSVQDCSISSALAMEVLQSCTKPTILLSQDDLDGLGHDCSNSIANSQVLPQSCVKPPNLCAKWEFLWGD